MYKIRKRYEFSAAHHIPTLPEGHKCKRPHGHNYTAEFEVMCSELNEHGFVMDFAEMDEAIKPMIEVFDHRDLNVVLGDGLATTSEFLAGYLFHMVDSRISNGEGIIIPPNYDPQIESDEYFSGDALDYAIRVNVMRKNTRTAVPRLMAVRVSETGKTWAEYTR